MVLAVGETPRRWLRTCQECGHVQAAKPPQEYKNEAWRELKCQKCKSIAMDYGTWEPTEEELHEFGPRKGPHGANH